MSERLIRWILPKVWGWLRCFSFCCKVFLLPHEAFEQVVEDDSEAAFVQLPFLSAILSQALTDQREEWRSTSAIRRFCVH